MARHELVDAYRQGRLARPVFLRRLRASGLSAAAALALAAALAPAGQAATGAPDGPGNSEAAAARLCAKAAAVGADDAAFVPLIWAASRKTGTGCPADGSDLSAGGPEHPGVDPQHNETLVRA